VEEWKYDLQQYWIAATRAAAQREWERESRTDAYKCRRGAWGTNVFVLALLAATMAGFALWGSVTEALSVLAVFVIVLAGAVFSARSAHRAACHHARWAGRWRYSADMSLHRAQTIKEHMELRFLLHEAGQAAQELKGAPTAAQWLEEQTKKDT